MRTQNILSPYSVMRAFRHGHATERAACIYDNPGAMHFRFTPELAGRLSREPNVDTFRRARPQVEERGRGAVGAAEVKRRGIGIMSPYSQTRIPKHVAVFPKSSITELLSFELEPSRSC
jgi:hypothetical protein